MKSNDIIEKHLRQSMLGLEVQPDAQSFHSIMDRLNKDKKRRRLLFFIWTGLGCVGIICSVWAGLNYFQTVTVKHVVGEKPNSATQNSPSHNETKNISIALTDSLNIEIHASETNVKGLAVTKKVKVAHGISGPSVNNFSIQKQAVTKNEYDTTSQIEIKEIPETNVLANVLSNESFLFLSQQATQLINKREDSELLLSPDTASMNLDSLLNARRKRIKFYIGLNFNPQISMYSLQANKDHSPVYDQTQKGSFPDFYLQKRKEQNSLRFNYAYGLKLGLNFKEKYELLVGFGFQKFSYREELYRSDDTVIGKINFPMPQSSFADMPFKSGGWRGKNSLTYLNCSMEGSKIFVNRKAVKLKAGLAVNVGKVQRLNVVYAAAPNIYNYTDNPEFITQGLMIATALKGGALFNAGKRWQFQICPNLFYSPTSMFNKQYVIKQKPIGVGLDCMILFRLF